MKLYITKWALTAGIKEREGVPLDGSKTRMAEVFKTDGEFTAWFVLKPDWHLTRQEAVKQAEAMRQKKLASLRKQLAKLEKMRFE